MAGYGAALSDSGTLTNAGTLQINGGFGGGRAGTGKSEGGGWGATVSVSGALTNTGTLLIQGGNAGTLTGFAGAGGVLLDTGVVTKQPVRSTSPPAPPTTGCKSARRSAARSSPFPAC